MNRDGCDRGCKTGNCVLHKDGNYDKKGERGKEEDDSFRKIPG